MDISTNGAVIKSEIIVDNNISIRTETVTIPPESISNTDLAGMYFYNVEKFTNFDDIYCDTLYDYLNLHTLKYCPFQTFANYQNHIVVESNLPVDQTQVPSQKRKRGRPSKQLPPLKQPKQVPTVIDLTENSPSHENALNIRRNVIYNDL